MSPTHCPAQRRGRRPTGEARVPYPFDRSGTEVGPDGDPLTLVGAVAAATNSYRQAILALIAFFIIGIILLFLTDTDKAVAQAKEAI